MARAPRVTFSAVRSEGGLLPPDFLKQVAEGHPAIPGLTSEAYHLAGTEKLNEAISRSWNRVLGAWAAFQAASRSLGESDPGTGLTREKWLLPLFQELGYGRLLTAKTFEVAGKAYPISHAWHRTAIHLVGRNVDLDRRSPGVVGAAKTSPHGLLQEFLNRAEGHLWGFLSNGLHLRILRDNKSLTRQAYVDFDLAGMMEGQVYADFALLWLLCHQSRVEADPPEQCWLERWAEAARQQGTRALDQLRDGVEKAIEALGKGFLAHPTNKALVERLRSGALTKQDYYRQLLRTVYRLIFLFVAEERDLLLTAKPGTPEHDRYLRYYSVGRLRGLAERRRGSAHGDLLHGLSLVFHKLSSDAGCPDLGLPALGSFLWSDKATPDLEDCELANADLLDAIRSLAFTVDGKVRRMIDYRNLGPEELGSVYESLLELHPEVNADAPSFRLTVAAGHERKTTGSYYTHASLVECLLNSALDPVLDEAAKRPDPTRAILNLKVCDPASGSGHFLIAAAHRIANRLASIRTGDEEPSPEAVRTALRDVIGRCIYGVDVNPMAVELCKVNLWLEALEPGKPLSFLEHRIQCGNSLLGATPGLIKKGIPDEAFEAIEGDDKAIVTPLRKRNRQDREGQMALPMVAEPGSEYAVLSSAFAGLSATADEAIETIRAKEEQYRGLVTSPAYRKAKLLADAWCAAFVWRKSRDMVEPVTEEVFLRLASNPGLVPTATRAEVERLAERYRFLHWHVAFPDVFRLPKPGEEPSNREGGWTGGFDVVLGNPPWERVKLQEKEWFATRRPDIAEAPNAAVRKHMIEELAGVDPALYREFLEDRRRSEGESHLIRNSGRYPLCGRGDVNTYAIFAETNRSLVGLNGRAGFIVQSDIATADTYKEFFARILERCELVSFYDFVNTEGLFPAVHRTHPHFCLITLSGRKLESPADFAFWNTRVEHLREEERHFTLTARDVQLLSPNTRTCPVFRSRRDADLTKLIYQRVPVLIREGSADENAWSLTIRRLFDMNKSEVVALCRSDSKDAPGFVPMYESKLMHQFDHRWATYDGTETRDLTSAEKSDAALRALPRYWIPQSEVSSRLTGRWSRGWLLGWRDITNTTNERTVIASVFPPWGTDFTIRIGFPLQAPAWGAAALLANLNARIFDYVARQMLGGTHLSDYVMKQLPVLSLSAYEEPTKWHPSLPVRSWLLPRVLELVYTAWDLAAFARDCGYDGPPSRWNDERRLLLRCELDAAFFHLYGIGREDVDYIMETFPIVKRKDQEKYANYRTKLLILDIYDRMQEAIATGRPYQTILDPPPADPRCCHPPKD